MHWPAHNTDLYTKPLHILILFLSNTRLAYLVLLLWTPFLRTSDNLFSRVWLGSMETILWKDYNFTAQSPQGSHYNEKFEWTTTVVTFSHTMHWRCANTSSQGCYNICLCYKTWDIIRSIKEKLPSPLYRILHILNMYTHAFKTVTMQSNVNQKPRVYLKAVYKNTFRADFDQLQLSKKC